MVTSGLRLGTPCGTARGFGPGEFRQIGELIGEVLAGLAARPEDNRAVEAAVAEKAGDLCRRFPLYADP